MLSAQRLLHFLLAHHGQGEFKDGMREGIGVVYDKHADGQDVMGSLGGDGFVLMQLWGLISLEPPLSR